MTTHTREEQLEAIRGKVIEAHGEESKRAWKIQQNMSSPSLADILLAIRHAPNGIAECHGYDGDFLAIKPSVGQEFEWKLRADLREQSDETITFIFNLLQ